ncbi:MAG: peptidase T, partial [Candidatus Bipolaricaulota bacterium]
MKKGEMTIDERLEMRFVRYAAMDSQSAEDMSEAPSTKAQLKLQMVLARELEDLGAVDVRLTEHGFVIATVPATV